MTSLGPGFKGPERFTRTSPHLTRASALSWLSGTLLAWAMGSVCPRHPAHSVLFLNSTGMTCGSDTPVDTEIESLGSNPGSLLESWWAGCEVRGAEPVSAGCHLLGQCGKGVPGTGLGPDPPAPEAYLPQKGPLSLLTV